MLNEFAGKNNIKFLNTFNAFRNNTSDSLLYYKHDGHWRPGGHKIMTDELKKFIVQNYFTEE